jgi:DNA-binding NarL/FixJ family response regulator
MSEQSVSAEIPRAIHPPGARPAEASAVGGDLLPTLTPREAEVLHWVAEGKRDAEIATVLGASTNTIHKHVQRILAKLGVETRTAAARMSLDAQAANGKRQPEEPRP